MHNEAQVQCVINYGAMFLKQKIKKEVAINMKLTRESYLQVYLEFILILSVLLIFHFSYVICLIMCRCLRGGSRMIRWAWNGLWTSGSLPSGRPCTTLVESGVCLCQGQHIIKEALATRNTELDGYEYSFH